MSLFGPNHYVPFLKGSRGEYGALEQVEPWRREVIAPFIDIPPLKLNGRQSTPAGLVTEQARQLTKAWGTAGPVFLDYAAVDPTARLPDGSHPFVTLVARASGLGTAVIP